MAAYNALMGLSGQGQPIDQWLANGGIVLTASERTTRALQSSFHQRRQWEGLSAWPAPQILEWRTFAHSSWLEEASDGRLLLNSIQEQALWADIISKEGHLATLLEAPRRRLATLAARAHELICFYAPALLDETKRIGWDSDAAAFGSWLSAFISACRKTQCVSSLRAILELTTLLKSSNGNRPPLLLVGFDRLLPLQKSLFDAWGKSQMLTAVDAASSVQFFEAMDSQSEIDACARWCARRLRSNAKQRILVITQDQEKLRGQSERSFLKHCSSPSGPLFEFSLGVPLGETAIIRSAHLALRWLSGALAETEFDWLIACGRINSSPSEAESLQAQMFSLRRRGLARPSWSASAFLTQSGTGRMSAAWVEKMTNACRRFDDLAQRVRSPLDWAAAIPELLKAMGWPGHLPLTSAEFQALHRWEQCLDACASLGFDGRRLTFEQFFFNLEQSLRETLYIPESINAPIQITGPAESAGLEADAIWFLGADIEQWPQAGSPHPFLPSSVQRKYAMPHANKLDDYELAHAMTKRILASAPEVSFSFARQNADAFAGPSNLIVHAAGLPVRLPEDLETVALPTRLTGPFEDNAQIPFPPGPAHGGSSILNAQSQCAFKAFAMARLGARSWEPAEAGLTASQRGQLIHAVLHEIWSLPPPDGLRSHADLLARSDLPAFVNSHVLRVFRKDLPIAVRERMPKRYLELEEKRAVRLLTEWLQWEAARLSFEVLGTEVSKPIQIAGLALNLRLDRVDRLNDGSLLIVDYKTGDVTQKDWDIPRPADVQLPLYATFALEETPPVGGLVFAKVRPNQAEHVGRVVEALTTLNANLTNRSPLVNRPLTPADLSMWRKCIIQLASDFIQGRADVNPRDYPRTCERCDLQSLCRVYETKVHLTAETGEGFDGE